jgi:hypothetical protein
MPRTEIYLLLSLPEYCQAMASPLYQPEQCHEQRSASFSAGQNTVPAWRHLCTNLSNATNKDLLPSLPVKNTVPGTHHCTSLSNATNRDLLPSLLVKNKVLTIVPNLSNATDRESAAYSPVKNTVQLWRHHCTNLSNATNRDLLSSLMVRNRCRHGASSAITDQLSI